MENRLNVLETERIIAILEDTTEKLSFLDRFYFSFERHLMWFIQFKSFSASRLTSSNIEMNCQNSLEKKYQEL